MPKPGFLRSVQGYLVYCDITGWQFFNNFQSYSQRTFSLLFCGHVVY